MSYRTNRRTRKPFRWTEMQAEGRASVRARKEQYRKIFSDETSFGGPLKEVHLSKIIVPNLEGYDTSYYESQILAGIPIPPLQVNRRAGGRYVLRDGFHRYVTLKKLGIPVAMVEITKPEQE